MRWPFVSRDRFEEKAAELDRVRQELSTLQTEHKRLQNWVTWRVGGGVAPEPEWLPAQYQPKTYSAVPLQKAGNDDEAQLPEKAPVAPRQARSALAKFETERMQDFWRARGGSQQPKNIPKEQIDLINRLNETVTEAQQAAGD